MVDIETNLRQLEVKIKKACARVGRQPSEVTLVAVTKGVGVTEIREAFACGIRHFGENRVQEAREKISQLADLNSEFVWHMVGHLQSNKAKIATELFDVIQSVDSLRLAEILNQHARQTLPILLQVNVSGETTKSGFAPDKVIKAVTEIKRLSNLEIKGLMTIAPIASDPEIVRPIFAKLRQLKNHLNVEHLSMGMSDDFEIAIEEGATIIRIGRAIFT